MRVSQLSSASFRRPSCGCDVCWATAAADKPKPIKKAAVMRCKDRHEGSRRPTGALSFVCTGRCYVKGPKAAGLAKRPIVLCPVRRGALCTQACNVRQLT